MSSCNECGGYIADSAFTCNTCKLKNAMKEEGKKK